MTDKTVAIIGGGLWGGLLARKLSERSGLKVTLYEKESHLGGNHTWSFHGDDVSPEMMKWIQPFITKSWNQYEVSFPKYSKVIPLAYHSLNSGRFNGVLRENLKESLRLGVQMDPKEFADLADIVFDARGEVPEQDYGGYQKFVGLDAELHERHGLPHPVLMDADVLQKDGYRFFYYLPWTENQLLIEDTRYSNHPGLDQSEIIKDIYEHCERKGWSIKKINRTETGVLPIPLKEISFKNDENIIRLQGIFHDTTGYSLPDALRLIFRIESLPSFELSSIKDEVLRYHQERKSDRQFFRLLNRLMFKAAKPVERFRVMEHFYRLPLPLIKKFYRGEMTKFERLRFFLGTPPVRIHKALEVIVNG